MAGDVKQLRARIVRPSQVGKPIFAAPQDGRHDSDGLTLFTVVGQP